MTQAGRAVLESLNEGELLQAAEILSRAPEHLNPATVRARLTDCLRIGAVRRLRGTTSRYAITPAGEALLERIWGADPAAPAWPDVR